MGMKAILAGFLGKIPIPTPAMVVALLALLIAASGAAVAAIPSNGTITACYVKSNGALRVIDTGQTCTSKETQLTWKDGSMLLGKNEMAADSDKLDNKDSTEFLGANQTAVDSDKLDGRDSVDFLGANQKAADADKLDGKDSSAFYAQGAKVADSSHADQADSAASATDTDLLDGKDSSEFQLSNPCPSGTLFHEGACIEAAKRGPGAFPNAESVCLQAERRLPTVAELQTFRLRGGQDFSTAEYTSQAWTEATGSTRPDMVMLVNSSGTQTPTSVFASAAFRCVAAANVAPPSEAWEAAAKSDLRNAAAAATVCAADNDGSYVNCGSAAQLSAYGFEKSPDVTYANLTATATRWVSATQHNDGGSAYQFDSATGNIQPVPRF
jgi:hypothetical protein